jgi:hypothetical protein
MSGIFRTTAEAKQCALASLLLITFRPFMPTAFVFQENTFINLLVTTDGATVNFDDSFFCSNQFFTALPCSAGKHFEIDIKNVH